MLQHLASPARACWTYAPAAACATNRRGAEAFGVAADEFDRYRPRYQRALVTDLIPGDGVRLNSR